MPANQDRTSAIEVAALSSDGNYVAPLSNAVIVGRGWLDELYRVIRDTPSVTIVGSRYYSLSGMQIGCGGVICSTGLPWVFGYHDDGRIPFYNYVRDADFVSTECALVERKFFISTGGFDSSYRSDRYRDIDLCTRSWKSGGRVLYNPFVRVFEEEPTMLESQEELANDHQVFLNRWHALVDNCPPRTDSPYRDSVHHRKPSVLFIDKFLPWHDRAAGAKRTMEILRLITKLGFHVTFVAVDGRNQEHYVTELEKLGVEVFSNDGPALGMDEIGAVPWEYLFYHRSYRFVWLTFWDLAAYYFSRLRHLSPTARFIVDSVDLEFVRLEGQARVSGQPSLTAQRIAQEIYAYEQADAVITVSATERDLLANYGVTKPIHVIPNIHRMEPLDQSQTYQSRDLLFVGNFNHLPNRDAMQWFCSEIFPQVHNQFSNKLLVVGNNPPEDILALNGINGIEVLGWIEDLTPVYHHVLAAIAPLRYGAGIKGKITEALSVGVPVIGTPEAIVGMEILMDREAVLLASSDPESWVFAVEQLLDHRFWNARRTNGWLAARDFFGVEESLKGIEEVFR